jgi:pimeloyl-ACP methyl ester carboxylesterase
MVLPAACTLALLPSAWAADAQCKTRPHGSVVTCADATQGTIAVGRIAIGDRPGRGVLPDATPTPIDAFPHQQIALDGWVEYNTSTCAQISEGTWTVTTKPKDGITSTGAVKGHLSNGACPNVTFEFGELYYIWTNTSTKDKTDLVAATWNAGAGCETNCSEPGTFDLDLVRSELTVIDPYLLTIPTGNALPVSTVVSAFSANKSWASGLMADGSSAAIAVFGSTVSGNVTFTATNGTLVATYNEDFLTSTAEHGAASLVVTPTEIDGEYYALALVLGETPPTAKIGTNAEIAAVTKGQSNSASYALATLPTPVVFVHGLWGDLSSLASTESYLNAANKSFATYPFLLTPICYSVYLAFDAATDTVPGNGAGCERTSAQALNQYFSTTLLPQLDANRFVGGRVDAVVHSMGGLAARHYASTTGYKSVRNRMLGAFRNVITLDTPETGSALATYLDGAYNRTLQVSTLAGTPYFLWVAECGLSSGITIETCFYNGGMPLAYKSMPLSTGAVASLIPGGKSISLAPAPGVFDASFGKWYAIDSDFKDGDQPASLLRDLLNNIVAATYASGKTPPTLTSILGTKDNDVIVTVASQTSTAPAAQTAAFKDLEHTPAPLLGYVLFPLDSNDSVVDSAAVNGTAAYWLGLQSTKPAAVEDESLPEQSYAESLGEIHSSERELQGGDGGARLLAQERLSIDTPEQTVALGQPVEITLHHSGGQIVDLAVDQTSASSHAGLRNESAGERVGSGRAKVISREGGITTIEVVPLKTGLVDLAIGAVFADGGFAVQHSQLNVVPSATGVRRFDLNGGFRVLALVLEDREEDSQASLYPEVQYDSMRDPIRLDNAEALNLTVEQPENDPVIHVDANGVVHAIRPGRAVVRGEFAGLADSVTVDVYTKESAPAGYRRVDAQTTALN